jgi:hypothetical protein
MQKKSVDYVSRQLPLQGLNLDSEFHSQESTQSEKLGQKPTDLTSMGKTNQTIGLAGEDLVRYLLHRWRFDIFEPCNPNNKCDFVIHTGKKWITIQVKTTESQTRIIIKREGCYSMNGAKRNFKSYDQTDFELLFLVKFPRIYIIPHEIIKRPSVILKDYEDYAYDLTDPEVFNNPPKL